MAHQRLYEMQSEDDIVEKPERLLERRSGCHGEGPVHPMLAKIRGKTLCVDGRKEEVRSKLLDRGACVEHTEQAPHPDVTRV